MSRQVIRAEDLDIADGSLNLGGRLFLGGAILSVQVERRVSAELLVYAGLLVACIVLALALRNAAATLAIVGLAILPALGAAREIGRPFVLVMNIFQIGAFEVRGFTRHEVLAVHRAVAALRHASDSPGAQGGRAAWSAGDP